MILNTVPRLKTMRSFLRRPGGVRVFKKAYRELEDEYTLARELLSARCDAGVTQDCAGS